MAWKAVSAGALLLIIVVAAYLPATQGGFIWDDEQYITENPDLQTTAGLSRIWLAPTSSPQYYPLVFSTFWVEYHLWDLRPEGYHWVNVFVHGLNSIFLWRLLCRLKVPGCWFAAAIFALHPVHVESVAWVTERKNVLSGLFYFAAALAYWRWAPPESTPSFSGHRLAWYAIALVLFFAALLSKTVTASLPAALALIVWWKRGKVTWRDGLALAPMLVLGVVLGLTTVWLEKHHVGAEGQEWALSWAQRLIIAGRALWFYAGKLLWPVDLTFIYPRWEIDAGVWWLYAYPLALVALLAALWRGQPYLGRGPLTACLFFVGTLIPALGFFDVYPMRFSFVADHFQYLASAGLIGLGVAASALAWRQFRPALQELKRVAAGAVLLLLATLTWGQCYIYRDVQELWADTLAKNPGCWLAHNYLGNTCQEQGLQREAEQHFSAAIASIPEYWTRTEAKAYSNRGVVREAQGKLASASADYQKAIQLDPGNIIFHLNLGSVLARQGKTEQAEQVYRQLLGIHPHAALAHYSLGILLAERGDWHAAADSFQRAVAIEPVEARFHYRLAISLRLLGKTHEAREEFQEAKRDPRWPDSAIQSAAYLTTHADARVRDGDLAVQLATDACQATTYGQPSYLDTLAVALAEVGRFDEAVALAQRGVELAQQMQRPDLEKPLREHLLDFRNRQIRSQGR